MIGARAGRLSQRQRRLLVLAEYASLVSYSVASILAESAWWLLIIIVFFAAVLIHKRLLAPFTQEIADKEDTDLDERQVAVRDSAHRTAYQIMGTLILGVLFLIWVITEPLGDRPWTPQIVIQDPIVIFVTMLWLLTTLPTAVIAWTEPDRQNDV